MTLVDDKLINFGGHRIPSQAHKIFDANFSLMIDDDRRWIQ